MLQHLTDYIDIAAGSIVSILKLDHIGKLFVGGNSHHLLAGTLDGFQGAFLVLKYASEHETGISHLGNQIRVVINEVRPLCHIGVQGIIFRLERVFKLFGYILVLRAVSLPESQPGRFLHQQRVDLQILHRTFGFFFQVLLS